MLIISDIEQCIPLAQELCDRGVRLEAKVGLLASLASETSVAAKVGASAQIGNDEEAVKNYIPNLVEMIHGASASVMRVEDQSVLETSNHDKKMDDFAKMAAQGVMVTVTRARQRVIPYISRIEDAINEKFNTYQERSIGQIGIDQIGLCEILDNEQVYSFFKQYANRRLMRCPSLNFFPELNDVELARLVEAGDPEINEYLQSVVTRIDEDNLWLGRFIYNNLFGQNGIAFGDIYELRNFIVDVYGRNYAIEGLMLAFYMLNGLVEHLPEGVNTGLKNLEHAKTIMEGNLGLAIFSEIENYRKELGRKVLLPNGLPYVDSKRGSVNPTFNIRVNKEVYAEFLGNGGTPEIIYGSMVSTRETDVNTLLDKREFFENEYLKFVNLNRAYSASSRLQLVTDAIREEFHAIAEDDEEIKAASATGLFLRLHNHLKRLGADDIKDGEAIYLMLRNLVSMVIYPENPEVEKVISDIDNYQDGDESLSNSEVAALVISSLVVEWLASQAVLVKA